MHLLEFLSSMWNSEPPQMFTFDIKTNCTDDVEAWSPRDVVEYKIKKGLQSVSKFWSL